MFIEVAIYGRGGHGGVTAARILATAAMLSGYYSQAMPQFGPERRGAEVKAYLRISDKIIRRKSPVVSPDIVVLFEETLKYSGEPETVVLNSAQDYAGKGVKFYTIRATEISVKYGLMSTGWPILGPPMAGAAAKALNLPLDCLRDAITMELGLKAENSLKAAEEAYRVVKCQ
jgi:pyruvate ferredoxin oxidoreductase gamma subunit